MTEATPAVLSNLAKVRAYVRSDGKSAVVYRGSNGHIYELAALEDQPWNLTDLSDLAKAESDSSKAPAAAGDPFGYVRSDQVNGVKVNAVVYRGSDGHIYELALQDQVWKWSDLFKDLKDLVPKAVPAAGDPFGYVRSDEVNDVLYRGLDGHIYHLFLAKDQNKWDCGDLFKTQKTTPPAAAGDPFGYLRPNEVKAVEVNAVLYRGSDGHICEFSQPKSGTWSWTDLSQKATAPGKDVPAAAGDPFGYLRSDGISMVVYRGTNSHIYALTLEGSGWMWTDFYSHSKAPEAAGDPLGYLRYDPAGKKISAVLYRGTNGHIYELALQGNAWKLTDLFDLATPKAPEVALGPFGYARLGYPRPESAGIVLYCGSNGQIHELAPKELSPKEQGWIVSSLYGFGNGRDIPTDTTIKEADVCVIGTGPAGISAAWKLAEAGLRVILLDGSRQLNYPPPLGSGDAKYYEDSWSDKKTLYAGVATGIFATNEPDFLIRPANDEPDCDPVKRPEKCHRNFPEERERVFGGTPVHNGGQCRPQDPVDIEGRGPAFPRWPITYDELDRFYKEASVANHLTGDYPKNFTTEFWADKLRLPYKDIPNVTGFDVEVYQFMVGKWKNFATRPWGESEQTIDRFVQIIVNATVLNIHLEGTSVRWVEVASMEDKYPAENPPDTPKVATRFRVKANIYILACGAVENARQLLLSKIGDKKLVGHYFMCHPLSRGEIIITNKSYLSSEQYSFMQGREQPDEWSVEGRFITNPQTTREKNIGRCWFWAKGNPKYPNNKESARMYFEMAPNYESYVTLDPDDCSGDPIFGQQRTKINLCLDHTTDKRTYELNCQLFDEALKALNKNSGITWPVWEKTFKNVNQDDKDKQWIVNGHHMGTTRMSVKPEEGVVDENLKVHGVDNLYVAGASVFPSGGISNPTFTIVALSLRLAEHVGRRLGKP